MDMVYGSWKIEGISARNLTLLHFDVLMKAKNGWLSGWKKSLQT